MESAWTMMHEEQLGTLARAREFETALEAFQIEHNSEVAQLNEKLQHTQIECGQRIARQAKAASEHSAEVDRLNTKVRSTQIECGQQIARTEQALTERKRIEEQVQALEGSWFSGEIDAETQHWAQTGAMPSYENQHAWWGMP